MKWHEVENEPGIYVKHYTKDEMNTDKLITTPLPNATQPRDKNKTDQDAGTDPRLFKALNDHFGFNYDLACTHENQLCKFGLTTSDDALRVDWHLFNGYLWLNPPYANIEPWALKCYEESLLGAKIVLLTPASVGSNWFRDWVYQKAWVRFLNGRLTFVGHKSPYPKDCQIAIFDNINFKMDVWDWSYGWDK